MLLIEIVLTSIERMRKIMYLFLATLLLGSAIIYQCISFTSAGLAKNSDNLFPHATPDNYSAPRELLSPNKSRLLNRQIPHVTTLRSVSKNFEEHQQWLLDEHLTSDEFSNIQRRCSPDKSSIPRGFERHKYRIEPVSCSGRIDVLFIISTRVYSIAKRNQFRNTWLSLQQFKNFRLAYIFVSTNDVDREADAVLRPEAQMYHDILLVDAKTKTKSGLDSSRFTLAVFLWTLQHCASTKYVTWINDDIFVHVPLLVTFLSNGGGGHIDDFYCATVRGKPIRSGRSKWRVSIRQYPYKMYPRYCSMERGLIVAMRVVQRLYTCSLYMPHFWIQDVFVSGILPRKLGLPPHRHFWREFGHRYVLPSEQDGLSSLFLSSLSAGLHPAMWARVWRQTLLAYI